MKKILVTGGAGFVGSHLCERLASDVGNSVVSLDNYFTGSEANHVPGVKYISGDTANIATIIDFVPDCIFHLGEYSRVEQSFGDMRKVWEYNTRGTFNVLEFARETACKLIYAGSSTKFGAGGVSVSSSPYAWSKSSNTELVKNYSDWFGLDYAITYFYNVYGGREINSGKYATLIGIFKEQWRKKEPLTIVKPGTQKRNFTHVDDIVDALILVGKYGKGDGFGIGSDEAFTVMQVAQMFGGNIEFLPERRGNRPDASVITEKTMSLGWLPSKRLEEHIIEFKNGEFDEA